MQDEEWSKRYKLYRLFYQKQSNLSDQGALKVSCSGDCQKDNQPQPTEYQRFEEFSKLPPGLSNYVAKDLIGTPLEDIDPFYKDKQVNNSKVFEEFLFLNIQ